MCGTEWAVLKTRPVANEAALNKAAPLRGHGLFSKYLEGTVLLSRSAYPELEPPLGHCCASVTRAELGVAAAFDPD